MRGWRRQGTWWLALLAGLLLRSMFVALHPRFVGDTLIYGDLAHNLLAHHIYGLTEGGNIRATLIRLPGYPLFLALCFVLFGTANYLAVVWVQVILDLAACLLVALAAKRLLGARAGLLALWIAALCPFTANYSAAALTETPSIFCVAAAFLGLTRWLGEGRFSDATMVGLALSWAVLLRPDGILLAGAVLPGMAWTALRAQGAGQGVDDAGLVCRRRSLAGLGVSLGLLLVCLGVWTLRNWRVYGVVQPLAPKYANDPGEDTPTGFARWYRTWGTGLGDTTRVYWKYDGSELNLRDLPSWAFDSPAQEERTAALLARYNDETSSTPAVEAAFNRLALDRIHAHPVRSLLLMPLARLGDMWLRPRTELVPWPMPLDWWDVRARPRAAAFSWGLALLNLALLLAAVLGVWRWGRRRWDSHGVAVAALLGYVLLRCGLLMAIDNSEPRYVLECYPALFLLAAGALRRPALPAQESRPAKACLAR